MQISIIFMKHLHFDLKLYALRGSRVKEKKREAL